MIFFIIFFIKIFDFFWKKYLYKIKHKNGHNEKSCGQKIFAPAKKTHHGNKVCTQYPLQNNVTRHVHHRCF
ncbi:MAG: hypothetical protein CR972_05260 [Candidatus Moraniibacteriota bacterium]|nr:MAG: hypothetical protein CR972_05260 [Candidatus Moranbacteria bacterium]